MHKRVTIEFEMALLASRGGQETTTFEYCDPESNLKFRMDKTSSPDALKKFGK